MPKTLTWINEKGCHGPHCNACGWLYSGFSWSGDPALKAIRREAYLERVNSEFDRHECKNLPGLPASNSCLDSRR